MSQKIHCTKTDGSENLIHVSSALTVNCKMFQAAGYEAVVL